MNNSDFWQKADNELKLLVELTKHPKLIDKREIKNILNTAVDWKLFVSLGRRHRLILPALRKLNEFPEYIPEATKIYFKSLQIRLTKKILLMNTELENVLNVLKNNGLEAMPMKGPKLAMLLYENPAERMSRDIDILIRKEDIKKASEVLSSIDYNLDSKIKKFHDKQLFLTFQNANQIKLFNHKKKIILELHWKLFNYSLLPTEINSDFEGAIRFLSTDKISKEYLLFLVVHGSIHFWFRLFWLRDIIHIIHKDNNIQAELLNFSREFGLDRIVHNTFELAKVIYGRETTEISEQSIKFNLKMIHANKEKLSITNTLQKAYIRSLMKTDIAFKFNVLKVLLFKPEDQDLLRFPNYLIFLNYPLAPFYRIYKYLKGK